MAQFAKVCMLRFGCCAKSNTSLHSDSSTRLVLTRLTIGVGFVRHRETVLSRRCAGRLLRKQVVSLFHYLFIAQWTYFGFVL